MLKNPFKKLAMLKKKTWIRIRDSRRPYTRANRTLTFQSHARSNSKVTSLIDRLKYTCDVTRDPISNRQSVTTVMDVSQRYRAYVTTCGHVSVELWNVKSCETYWILLGRLMMTHVSFEISKRPVDIDNHKLSSWKVVHQCEHVYTHWWTTFQLLSLWLSMSTRLGGGSRHVQHVRPNRGPTIRVAWVGQGGLRACVCGSKFFY